MSELIPEDYYPAVATRVSGEDGNLIARFALTSEKNKQVLVYFTITEGPYAGTRVPWFGYFTANSGVRTLESLRYCGWKGDKLSLINDEPLDQLVSIEVEHNTYNEKTQARVAWVNRPGGGVMKLADPMSAADLAAFSAACATKAKAIPVEAGLRVDITKIVRGGGEVTPAGGGGGGGGQRAQQAEEDPFGPAQGSRGGSGQGDRGGGGRQQQQRGQGGGGGRGSWDDNRDAPPPGDGDMGRGSNRRGPGPDDDIPFATAEIGAEPSGVAAILRRIV